MSRQPYNFRATARTEKRACRVDECDGGGYGGYCTKHTPKGGAGVLTCGICKGYIVDHDMVEQCVPTRNTEES